MIIDSHIHMGKILNFNMSEETILASMDKYGIDFSLVSNIEGSELDHNQNPIPIEEQFGQIELNKKLLDFVRKNSNKLGALLWIKPRTEGCTPEFQELIAANRDIIYGIKVHPYHSKTSLGSVQVAKYIELARKYSLPIVTHTASDYESSPRVAYEVALQNPDVNIVMYHMGLGTDNEEAIELISKLPNLYGDTAWVEPEKVMKAIKVCGIGKILFGTDNPINGLDTYNDDRYYNFYFKDMKNYLSKEDYDKFMFGNSAKLFNIKGIAY
jgi:predicted TIM-barrel fold metal-dependent hydrolase